MYVINVADYSYKDGSEISVWFESLNSINAYVFAGNDRWNTTTLIESDRTAAVGAPITVPISTGLVVVAKQTSGLRDF